MVSILFITMKHKWTDIEIKRLEETYSNSTNTELLTLFSGRSLNSIKLKAKRLKLNRDDNIKFKNGSDARIGEKNGMYGKKSPKLNKTYDEYYGKNKSKYIKNKISLKNRGNKGCVGNENGMHGKVPYNKGISPSNEIKNKIKIGIKRYWDNLSEYEYNKRKNQLKINWIKIRDNYVEIDTVPEKITEDLLIKLDVEYRKKINIGYYNCDFVVNNKVIEVQGDYWHANPKIYENRDNIQEKNYNRDERKLKYLNDCGYDVLYLWECDLKNKKNDCESKIKKFI